MIKKTLFNGVFDGLIIVLVIIVATFTIYILTDNQDVNNTTHLAPVNEDIDTVKSEDVKMENDEDVNDAIVYESKSEVVLEPSKSQMELQEISEVIVTTETKNNLDELTMHSDTENQHDHKSDGDFHIDRSKYPVMQPVSDLTDKQIDAFIRRTQEKYENHELPELRRFAELSPKIIRGEVMTAEETHDFLKAAVILNPIAATKRELSKFERQLKEGESQ